MNNADQENRNKQLSSGRKYPPLWEKSIPVLISIAGIAAFSLIIIAVFVILGNAGS